MAGGGDAGGDAVLAAFGVAPDDLIGTGGQSEVYALGASRILRVLREPDTDGSALRRLQALLAEIDGRLAVPTAAIETIDGQGRYTVERRLAGRSMLALLPGLEGTDRATAFRNYALGAEVAAAVLLPDRPYGQVLCDAPIRTDDWHDYLRQSLDRFLAANAAAISTAVGEPGALRAKALALLDGTPRHPPKALVHGDYFPGNVLLDDSLAVSGLVDFSIWTVVGDAAIDLAGAAIFLEMIAEATADDVAAVRTLLLARHGPELARAGGFYRAYFAFAMADPGNSGGLYPKLYPWSVANLKALAAGRLAF